MYLTRACCSLLPTECGVVFNLDSKTLPQHIRMHRKKKKGHANTAGGCHNKAQLQMKIPRIPSSCRWPGFSAGGCNIRAGASPPISTTTASHYIGVYTHCAVFSLSTGTNASWQGRPWSETSCVLLLARDLCGQFECSIWVGVWGNLCASQSLTVNTLIGPLQLWLLFFQFSARGCAELCSEAKDSMRRRHTLMIYVQQFITFRESEDLLAVHVFCTTAVV